jgi:hypothetical protein
MNWKNVKKENINEKFRALGIECIPVIKDNSLKELIFRGIGKILLVELDSYSIFVREPESPKKEVYRIYGKQTYEFGEKKIVRMIDERFDTAEEATTYQLALEQFGKLKSESIEVEIENEPVVAKKICNDFTF